MQETGILVVTYNQLEITRKFILNFLDHFSSDKYYLLVLDNNSADGTFEILRNEFPSVDIRKLNDNYGCVTGRNVGIVELMKIGAQYIYITDNDIVFTDKDYFVKLINFLEKNSGVDACCPVVKWEQDNTIQTLGARIKSFGRYKNVDSFGSDRKIHILPGCAQFVRTRAFEKFGLYDNDLTPFSIEDLEWGIRAAKQGAIFEYYPDVEVLHLHRKNKKSSSEMMKYIIEGRVIFLRKYFNLYNLFREIKHFAYCIKDYGFMFSIKKYSGGFKKKVTKNNFDINNFETGLKKYYIETR